MGQQVWGPPGPDICRIGPHEFVLRAPHSGEHLTFTLDGCLCVLDGITNIISKTILGVGLYISAKISMNVSGKELFSYVRKNDKYHDFLKGNSKCCHYLVDFRLAKKQQIGEFRRNEFLVAHYFKLRGK